MNLEPVLWKKWVGDIDENDVIIGEWAEDGNPYIIHAPCQLRDMIVKMQNDAVDANENAKPKKEICGKCAGKGFHYVSALDKKRKPK